MQYRRIIFHAFLWFSIVITFSCNAFAQDTIGGSGNNYFWINGGVGVGSLGLAGGAGLTWVTPDYIISVRYAANTEFNIFGPTPEESVVDVGLLYGIYSSSKYGFASIAAGLSYVNGVRRGKILANGLLGDAYEKVPFQTIGIPLEAQLIWRPFSVVGIGFYFFADINSEMSNVGGLITLQIGYLR